VNPIIKNILFCILTLLILVAVAGLIFTGCSNKITSAVDNYIYELPYKPGTSHKVIQGYGGLLSHSHEAALDFKMPVGTEIYAARDGDIYRYKDDSNKGGLFVNKHMANFIIIRHSDGSFGCYWHLKQNGVLVTSGHVHRGQLIGYSGNTGFTLQPHLHFSVKRRLSYDVDSYIQTKFQTNKGVVFLRRGKTYSNE
jgi:murein DD-endopeptidase MepM/ murein hydrolase activator NlpD